MKRNIQRIVSLLLGLCLSFSLAACGEKKDVSSQNTGANGATASTASNTSAGTSAGTAASEAAKTSGTVYPIKTDVTLTIWSSNNKLPGKYNDKNNLPFYEGLEKRTGVKLECITPVAGQEKDTFNLMVASRDLPDIVQYGWLDYPGGPQKAIDDKVILSLNDLIDQYAPNLKKVISSDKELGKMLKTDGGNYYVFPFIREDPFQQVYRGPFFRKDWLDELGLKVPETVDEWYTALKAFKEKKGATAPLTVNLEYLSQIFAQAYKVLDSFYYDDNGKLQYGPIQTQFKDYLTEMKKWYDEDLIDKDFSIRKQADLDTNILSGKSGATIGNASGQLGKYLDAMKGKDDKFDLVASYYPVLKGGETPFRGHSDPKFTGKGTTNAAITASCKNTEIAAKFLDYCYSDEGKMYINFGEEGVAHTMVNGYPTYSELITKNPEGLSFSQACQIYTSAFGFAFVQDKRYTEQLTPMPQQKEAINKWVKTDREKHDVPSYANPTGSEASDYATIITNVETFRNESMVKFIMGADSLDNFDKYADQIKKMGIEKALQIKQNALDKYNSK
ncbi:MAG: extracellular solute-binding protein [Clostridiaceae bacterium]